jgi:hypothetical protein
MRRTAEQIEIENEKTYQYVASLAKSRKRVNSADFNHLNIKLTDRRLLTLLLAVAEHRLLHLPTFCEELLTQALRSRDKTFRRYFENEYMTVDIQDTKALTYGNLEVGTDFSAEQLQRMNGGPD